ncbi:hypothetical protein ACERK3_05255 [Phycisphaerales bacterium AB-hyl4]|uniref:Uncharacterized protein n=1 Tax=Natronomicrosphaera hydrolytica TaxID=3242702 RepID=A0ABV4U5E1_9BACT
MHELTKEQRGALMNLRIIWAALLLGQLTVGAVLLGVKLTAGDELAPAGGADWLFVLMAVAVLVVLAPTAYFARNQFYKAKWQGDAVAPSGYVNGNIVLLAMLEGAGVTALVMMFISDRPLLPGLVAVVAILLQAVNFPTGEPMRPHPPEFARTGD